MKPSALVLALATALGSGCTSMEKAGTALNFQPVQAVRHGAPDAQAYYQLGRYYHGQNRSALAEDAYLKAINADDRHLNAHNGLATLYAERGELERAAAMFTRLTRLAPDNAYLFNNIGYVLYLDGRYQEAVDALRNAVTLDPAYERGWTNLQTVAAKAGMTELADLAARHQLPALPAHESQPSQDAGSETSLAVAAPASAAAEPDALRLTMTPTLKLLTEPTNPAAVVVVEAPTQAPVEVQPATVTMAAVREPETAVPPVLGRIEVSNGNGITRFATRLGKQLRSEGVRVSRITNNNSYQVQRSYIEYRPEWSDAAYALRDRLGMQVAVQEAKADRRGTDVRLVLGRDSVPHLASLLTPPESPDTAKPLLLTRNDR